MKKFIAMLLAVMMLLAFAGCADKEEKPESVAEEQSSPTEKKEETATLAYKGTVSFKNDAYNNLTVDVSANDYTVTDEAIDAKVASYAEYLGTTNLITDRPIANGDVALIDYVGSVDGVEFEGGTATDSELEIGSHSFIDDFEEQLIGAKAGDEVKVEVTFPEDYHAADLAGKDAVFMVTVKGINEYVVPEMNDETAKELGYDDLAAARAEAKAELEAEMEEQRATDIQNAIWKQIEEIAEVTVDDADKQVVIERTKEEYENAAASYGMDLETLVSYSGMTMDDFEKYCEDLAESEVKYYMTVRALAKEFGIEISEDEFSKTCSDLAVKMGYESVDAFEEDAKMTMEEYYTRAAIEDYIFSNNVLETLKNNATVIG